FGLAVTGVVDPEKMMSNDAAKPGDVLVLTKALGTGFITTANKAYQCPDDVLLEASESMKQLNRVGSEAALELGVKATTDITGFGFAGHALEMAQASGVTIELHLDQLPILHGAEALAKDGHHTRANPTNRAHVEPTLSYNDCERNDKVEFLYDPQTSGGLLIAIDEAKADDLVAKCISGGMEKTAIVGRVCNKGDHALVIHP
ncbi:MAG: selenide, water dikinase SelD, partial [Planctomycetota bacterium]|nr:selenide, water dikinase SelD [Planctomycetota bacterium]